MPDAAMILSSGLPRRPPRRLRMRAVRSPSVVEFHHVGRPAPVRGLSPPVWNLTKPRITAICLFQKKQVIIYTHRKDLSSISVKQIAFDRRRRKWRNPDETGGARTTGTKTAAHDASSAHPEPEKRNRFEAKRDTQPVMRTAASARLARRANHSKLCEGNCSCSPSNTSK